jgi:acetamidase/formamidase
VATDQLGIESIHTFWDRSLEPKLHIEPGDTVVFRTREPSQGGIGRENLADAGLGVPPDLLALVLRDGEIMPAQRAEGDLKGHALTGPVAITGAEPGDALLVEVLSVVPNDWGWTALGPGGGSLLADELSAWYLHLWDLREPGVALFAPEIRVPTAPFCGVMGVAPAEPGQQPTPPPTNAAGGNMDVRQLVAGSRLWLPVQVPGALFSVGDAHAAQGDGEVAGTGIETDATVTLRFDLRKREHLGSPRFETPEVARVPGPWFATTGHDPDLKEASRQAMREMCDYLKSEHGLELPQAMVLASACVDLRISQIVNVGVYTVSAFLPLSIFER